MDKIKIEDLCSRLKNNINEKKIFFQNLSSEKFLMPFYKEQVFNFSDEASFWIIQYLIKVFSNNTENLIISIVNQCIHNCEITKKNYKKLLDHRLSIELIKILLKKSEIMNDKELTKMLLNTLLRYRVEKKTYDTIAQIDHEIYQVNEIIQNNIMSENLKHILQQNFIFDLLIKKYKEAYKKTVKNKNTLSDVFSIQTIDPEEIIKSIKNDYRLENFLDIILLFLCINLSKDDEQKKYDIESLFSEQIFMLRKLGLHVIYVNPNQYLDLLSEFFKHVNKNNVVNITYICLYELVKIFKVLEKFGINDDLKNIIEKYIELFPRSATKLKYDVLHGLKWHEYFRKDFDILKNLYKYEKEEPGIYISEGIGGWVKNVSPISEDEFKQKSIAEQIDYINSDITYSKELKQINKDTIEEINELGLVELFRKVLNENINYYIDNSNIELLTKKNFIKIFIEVLSQKIDNITNLNRAILLVNKIYYDIKPRISENQDILYEIISFNINIASKAHKHFNKIFATVEAILRDEYDESHYNDEEEPSFIALNTILGRNFRCFMDYFVRKQKLSKKDKSFLAYIMKKEKEEKFKTFYYYLGVQYQFLDFKHKTLNLYEKISNLGNIALKFFINGYLSYCNEINCFKTLKDILLTVFSKGQIEDKMVRTRFVQLLTDMRLQFNEKDIFSEFSKYFLEDDFLEILHYLKYKENPKYSGNEVMQLWEEIVNMGNKQYVNSLLCIFNKYCDASEFSLKEEQLRKVIELGFPEDLIANQNIDKFLSKLLDYIKESKDCVTTYNILYEIILAMNNVKYIYDELDKIKDILQEFENLGKRENAVSIANKIYKTSSLNFYVKNIKEFLIES